MVETRSSYFFWGAPVTPESDFRQTTVLEESQEDEALGGITFCT